MKPERASIPRPWDHYLSQNHELEAKLTEPPSPHSPRHQIILNQIQTWYFFYTYFSRYFHNIRAFFKSIVLSSLKKINNNSLISSFQSLIKFPDHLILKNHVPCLHCNWLTDLMWISLYIDFSSISFCHLFFL